MAGSKSRAAFPASEVLGKPRYVWIFSFFLLLAVSCKNYGEKTLPLSKPLIALSIVPQEWFAARIAGDFASFLVLAGPGQNPHSYEPAPRDMALLARAECWILSGTEFEISLVPRVASQNPSLKIIDGTKGMRFRMLEEHHDDDEEAGGEAVPAGSPSGHAAVPGQAGMDRHTWLGREQAIVLAGHILAALEDIDSEHSAVFRENYRSLVADINRVFDELKTELAPLRGRKVFVYHPAFGYFLDEFGIIQEAVETGGKEPTPRVLRELIAEVRAEKAAAVFVQAQFPVQSARTVAEAAGARVVALDPLAPLWLDNIRVMGNALLEAVQP
ncbi:MAG: zinc ABC transporter substrate-binding protein [Spirochaetaceae bacterium]|jgi:zinc transport system substrate-binding protein|nr:zinc ABC transporter substrate-binding protein [Spirochaetaceae bacterium]